METIFVIMSMELLPFGLNLIEWAGASRIRISKGIFETAKESK